MNLRISTFSLLILILTTATAYSQHRNINVELKSRYPSSLIYISQNEDAISYDRNMRNNYIHYDLINLGPDYIKDSDSLIFQIPSLGFEQRAGFIGLYGDTALYGSIGCAGAIYLPLIYNPDTITNTHNYTQNVCDTVWIIDKNGAVVNDIDLSNNYNCHNAYIAVWFLDVADVNKAYGFDVYPNPAATTLNITSMYTNAKNASVIIRDFLGKTVLFKDLRTNLNGQQTFSLDIGHLFTGFYVIELNVDGKRATRQMQIQK